MIPEIDNNFVAYMTINKTQLFASINEMRCKFFPIDENNNLNVFNYKINKGFIHGVDENNHKVALWIDQHAPVFVDYMSSSSSNYIPKVVPIIVKGHKSNNEDDDLTTFDAITFRGNAIDAMYPPGKNAIKEDTAWKSQPDGARKLAIHAMDKYTHKYSLTLFNEPCAFIYSISQSAFNYMGNDLGSLNSIIRIEFVNPQKIEFFEEIFILIRNFIAFCVGQRNIKFDCISINRRISKDNNEHTYSEIGIAKVFDEFSDYANPGFFNSLKLLHFKDHITRALTLFSNKKDAPIISFLPLTNKDKKRVSYSNVRDMCTAFEYEFSAGKYSNIKLKCFDELKVKLKETIDEYCSQNDIDENLRNQMHAPYQHMGVSTKDKIKIIRDEAQKKLYIFNRKELIKRQLSDDEIDSFVKLRNEITHGKLTSEWDDAGKIYTKLFRLIYVVILARIGIPDNELYAQYQITEKLI